MTMMMVRTSEITKEEEGRGRKSDSSAEMSSNAMGFSPSRAAATISGVSSVPTANATIGEKFTLKDDRLDCGGVRTARFKMMKPPRFPIKISSNISNHLGLRLVDLLDSPILQPPNEASLLSLVIVVFMQLRLLLRMLGCVSVCLVTLVWFFLA